MSSCDSHEVSHFWDSTSLPVIVSDGASIVTSSGGGESDIFVSLSHGNVGPCESLWSACLSVTVFLWVSFWDITGSMPA